MSCFNMELVCNLLLEADYRITDYCNARIPSD